MAGDNGDRFNRAMRASAAYAELQNELKRQNALLFKDPTTGKNGYLPRIEEGIAGLYKNPLVRLGFWMDTRFKALVGAVGALAAIATLVSGVHAVGVWVGWWK